MNLHSSRSHAIFTVTIECSEKYPDGKQHVRVGKLHLVDLAVITHSYLKHYLFFPFINTVNGHLEEHENLNK